MMGRYQVWVRTAGKRWRTVHANQWYMDALNRASFLQRGGQRVRVVMQQDDGSFEVVADWKPELIEGRG